MKNNKKMSTLILVLVLMITAVISGTFAYWQWITSTEQQTLVNVSLTDDATIYIDFPENELTNLYPTSNCEANGTSSWVTDITVNNGTGVKLATNFKLKIKIEDKDGNVITNGTNEWNDHDFKYYVKFAVTEANESCKNALYTGRFDTNNLTYQNVATNDEHYAEITHWYDSSSITLKGDDGFPVVSSRIGSGVSFHAYPNTETSHTYKVWVWLDEEYTSVTVGEDSTLDKLQDAKITVSWSENSELEQIRESAEPEGEAIAIYSEDDNSLRFYRETNPDSIGSTYNGRSVTNIYTGLEDDDFNAYDVWGDKGGSIRVISLEDYIYPVNTSSWFVYFTNVEIANFTKLDTSNVTDMAGMFYGSSINANLSDWDTSNVTDMSSMFYYFLGDVTGLENWDTSNVTSMYNMFYGTSINANLSGWNVCNVTNYNDFGNIENIIPPYFGNETKCNGQTSNDNFVSGSAIAIYSSSDSSLRFYRVEEIPSLGNTYNGRAVTRIYTDFENSTFEDSSDVPWNELNSETGLTYSVNTIVFEDYIYPISTAYWFQYMYDVGTMDIIKLNTSSVTNMEHMFSMTGASAESFNILGLENLDTSNVTDMSTMFYYFGQYDVSYDLSTFDTSKVTSMSYMFNSFKGNITGIENWNTSNVTNMSDMFDNYSYTTESLDLSGWNVCKVTSYSVFSSYRGEVPNPYVTSPNFGNSSKCNGGNPAA